MGRLPQIAVNSPTTPAFRVSVARESWLPLARGGIPDWPPPYAASVQRKAGGGEPCGPDPGLAIETVGAPMMRLSSSTCVTFAVARRR